MLSVMETRMRKTQQCRRRLAQRELRRTSTIGMHRWKMAPLEMSRPSSTGIGKVRKMRRLKAFWPDDDAWLPATVARKPENGLIRIAWEADGSFSDVPLDFVRRPASAGKPAARTAAQKLSGGKRAPQQGDS